MSRAGAGVSVVEAETAEHLAEVKRLFRLYFADSVNGPISGNLERELTLLPAPFEGPGGRLLLALSGSRALGCVGLRPLGAAGVCEMKRMFVDPAARGRGVGRLLAEALLCEAAEAGYEIMRLDTLPTRTAAVTLYRSLGFVDIAPYWDCPREDMLFMERRLRV